MTNDQLAADVAELKRQVACVIRWANPKKTEYTCPDLYRDLTTPPPKERPKIEVVKINAPDSWNVTCGEWKWCGDCWVKSDGYWYSEHDARAIAAALEAAGNYPEEYKEKAR